MREVKFEMRIEFCAPTESGEEKFYGKLNMKNAACSACERVHSQHSMTLSARPARLVSL